MKPALLLVGHGRFGAFALKFLRRRFTVHVLERKGRRPLPRGVPRARIRDIGRFDLALLAMPAHRLRAFLSANGGKFKRGAFVADLCAVKAAPMRWMRSSLPRGVSFAGLHPLFGPDSAAGGIEGLQVVVCRGRSDAGCHRRLMSTIRRFGLKPVETTAAFHDKTIAYTLLLTQLVGVALNDARLAGTQPFETPSSRLLKIVAARAARNSPDLLGELKSFNPHAARVARELETSIRRRTPRH